MYTESSFSREYELIFVNSTVRSGRATYRGIGGLFLVMYTRGWDFYGIKGCKVVLCIEGFRDRTSPIRLGYPGRIDGVYGF